MKVSIFTDGACRGNPGPGGWGVVCYYGDHQKTFFGAESLTTNNRMELTAALQGLECLNRPCQVDITTDSQYVRQGITQWMTQWKRRGWRTSANKAVKNQDLWQLLDAACARHQVAWHWVKGHAGHPDNELADQLANQAIDQMNEAK